MIHRDFVLYVEEELDNIRTALVDSGVPYLVATEATLRPAAQRLHAWVETQRQAAHLVDDEKDLVAAAGEQIPY